MKKRRNIGIGVLVALAFFVWRFGSIPAGDPIPAVDCPFEVDGLDLRVTCFQVPFSTGTVLATVLHQRPNPLEDAPVLILGSDQGATPSFDLSMYASMALLDQRDLVLVDPLGTGHTSPSVDCFVDVDSSNAESVVGCRDRLVDAGLLDQWSTAQQIERLVAVHEALSEGRPWRRWHVVARGYGTQVAMGLASAEPGSVASMVLSSVAPPGAPSFVARARSFAPSVAALQMECATDGGCNDLDPLGVTSDRVTRRLATTPEAIEVLRSGDRTSVYLDGSGFRSALSLAMETPTLPSIIPWAVARVDEGASEFGLSEGSRDTLAGLVSAAASSPTVDPMLWWHLTCSEQMPSVEGAALSQLMGDVPELVAPADPTVVCAGWPTGGASVTTAVVERPTLVLETAIDPLTTADWVEETLVALDDPVVLTTAQSEWMPGASRCSAKALEAWFAHPGEIPDSACLTDPIDITAHPVPVGSVRQIGGLGETSAMAMGTVAVLATVGLGMWIQVGRAPGLSGVLWRVSAALNAWGFIGGAAVLVSGSSPTRLVAQPWWSWVFFGMPWIVVVLAAAATVATVQDFRAGVLAGRWPSRYALVGIGVAITFVATILLGILPGT